jgi:hypothetical protein
MGERMRGSGLGVRVLGMVLALSGLAVTPRAQQNTTPGRPPMGADGLPSMGLDLPPGQKEKQAKMQNEDRQKQLVADTDRLLQLATELHTDVEKTDKNVLSVDVIKKADEIEKLAHAVKAKMRG